MNTKTKGILYVIMAAFGFSMMSAFVHLAGDLPFFQKAFFRNVAALFFVAAVMLKNRDGGDIMQFLCDRPSCFGRREYAK